MRLADRVDRSKFNVDTSARGKAMRTVDGIVFASQAEARRYCELKLLVRAGEISDLELQPRFVLQEPFKDRYGNRVRAITYVADFSYRKIGQFGRVVEDVKGRETEVFRIKRKMFLRLLPQWDLRIVKA